MDDTSRDNLHRLGLPSQLLVLVGFCQISPQTQAPVIVRDCCWFELGLSARIIAIHHQVGATTFVD